MSQDYVAEQSWLDELITHPENPTLFQDENQLAIQKELAKRWIKENRLELLEDLSARYGEESVFAVIDKIIYVNNKRNWEQIGKGGDNSLERFIKLLWGPLRESGFEYSFETEGNKTQFCVTKCPVYDFAKRVGAEKWFYHLFCLTDEPAVVGFNGKIEFTRTRTFMQGHSYCDHCYTVKS